MRTNTSFRRARHSYNHDSVAPQSCTGSRLARASVPQYRVGSGAVPLGHGIVRILYPRGELFSIQNAFLILWKFIFITAMSQRSRYHRRSGGVGGKRRILF